MARAADFTKCVQYELMRGRDAVQAIRDCPVGYLPIGCLERHGDHLPMGLDVLKAHGVCCEAARTLGGVVFSPHYYAGIHLKSDEELKKFTGEWGNLYTDRTAKDTLTDTVRQLAIVGVRALVLYTGHYPGCQVDMVREIAAEFADHPTLTVIPFAECMILQGDHAGISETSFGLYLHRHLVDMTRIGEVNYQDHYWPEERDPKKATAAKGEADTGRVIDHLEGEIDKALDGGELGVTKAPAIRWPWCLAWAIALVNLVLLSLQMGTTCEQSQRVGIVGFALGAVTVLLALMAERGRATAPIALAVIAILLHSMLMH